MAIWISLWAVVGSRLFAFDQFTDPNRRMEWILIAVATVAASIRRPRTTPMSGWTAATAMVAGAGLCAFADAPYRTGGWMILAGTVLTLFATRSRFDVQALRRLSSALLFVGQMTTILTVVYPFYGAFTARNPEITGIAGPTAALLEVFGMRTGASGNDVFIETLKYTHRLPLTFNHFAAFPALLFLIGGAILVFLQPMNRPRRVSLARLFLVTTSYVFVRFALVMGVFLTRMLHVPHDSDRVHVELFWLPSVVTVSFLPLTWLLARCVGTGTDAVPAPTEEIPNGRGETGLRQGSQGSQGKSPSRRTLPACVAACAAAVVFGNFYHDAGVAKRGRILFDDAHGPWESTTRPLDTDWYGQGSGYNYWGIAEYLDRHFDVDRHRAGPLTAEALDRCDVLIVKTPTEPYTAEEIDAVESFVRNGGGLMILGEHSNVFGSGTYGNMLSERFGIHLRYDCVFDIDRKWEEIWDAPKLGRHPASQRVPFFQFAVSASIDCDSWNARPILRSDGLWTLPIDYRTDNFYPEVLDHTYATFGTFDQAVSNTHGAGRIVVFADSTVFSNFGAFQPGRIDFLLDSVSWLNHRNRTDWLNSAAFFAAAAFAAAAIAVILRRGLDSTTNLRTISLTAVASIATLLLCDAWSRYAYPRVEPKEEIAEFALDVGRGDYELPIYGFTTRFEQSYDTFAQWFVRAGFFPKVVVEGESSWHDDNPVLLIRPFGDVAEDDLRAARSFVERGGTLCVLDGPGRPDSSAHRWLAPFGVGFGDSVAAGQSLCEPVSMRTIDTSIGGNAHYRGTGSLETRGGEVLLCDEEKTPVLSWVKYGKGRVFVGGLAEHFGDPGMGGHHDNIPNDATRRRFEVAFTLMRSLVADDPSAEFRSLAARAAR